MKTKLLRKIRKQYQIVYNPEDDCYLVRDKKCRIKKYEATSSYADKSLKWYDHAWNYIEVDHKRYAFYWMLANLGFKNVLDDHVRAVIAKGKIKEAKLLYKAFKLYYNIQL